jgi:hypothetical protein
VLAGLNMEQALAFLGRHEDDIQEMMEDHLSGAIG